MLKILDIFFIVVMIVALALISQGTELSPVELVIVVCLTLFTLGLAILNYPNRKGNKS
jgi:hypothetical protein